MPYYCCPPEEGVVSYLSHGASQSHSEEGKSKGITSKNDFYITFGRVVAANGS
jgi:hypothetical protein